MKQTAEILQTKVSMFPNIKDTANCITITLDHFLTSCMNPTSELKVQVDKIRAEKDEDKKKVLKAKMPGVVVGAEMKNRIKLSDEEIKNGTDSRIIQLTGLLCFDIDKKDNPGMNPVHVRNELSKTKHVIFVALSVSGTGVFGLVQTATTDHKQHFEQLKADFKLIGIKLDPSKGSNPTDVRFYSCDPDAYLSKTHKVYDRLPKPQKKLLQPRNKVINIPHQDIIQRAVNMVNKATDGEKHAILLKASKLLGGYVSSGAISQNEAQTALENAIKNKNIVSFSDAQKTITDGIKYGLNEPIQETYIQSTSISTNMPAGKVEVDPDIKTMVDFLLQDQFNQLKVEQNGIIYPLPLFVDYCFNVWNETESIKALYHKSKMDL